MSYVFVYGSLRHDTVVARVIARVPPSVDAVLRDHELVRVTGEVYPTVRRRLGSEVPGRVLVGVRPGELARLDVFEGAAYRRVRMPVRRAQTGPGGWGPADVYVHRGAASMAPVPWRYEQFRRDGLDRFLGRYRGFDRVAC